MKGYMNKLLHINLTDNKIEDEILDEKILRKYIGGSGLGLKILFEETDENTNPLSPENVLIFMCGPFPGTDVPCSGRHSVVAKSPITNMWGEASVGGSWAVMLKKSGYDGIIIRGKAKNPSYLWINDGKVEIRDAKNIWGKDSYELDEILKKETHEKAEITSIGLGGENLVKFACIMNDGTDGRAAGRCGLGAVMGSKKLKAIAVYGKKKVPVYEPDKLKESIKVLLKQIQEKTEGLGKFGTSAGYLALEKMGNIPIKNWTLGNWEKGAEQLTGQKMAQTILTGRFYCKKCVIGCGRRVKIENQKYGKVDGAGPEYETLALMGSNLLIDDLEAISVANEWCNRYGLDTISVGGVIAFAMEAYEKGLIKKEDTNGFEIRWGDPDVLINLVHMIAKREGVGDLLANGVKIAAEKIGGMALEMAIHVKGLELPAHDPRASNSAALSYAISNRGACHLATQSQGAERALIKTDLGFEALHDRYAVERTAELVSKMGDLMCTIEALGLCRLIQFGGVDSYKILEWLNNITGWEMEYNEFMMIGKRLYELKRLYNVRCGISRKDDTLPARMLTHRRRTGGTPKNLAPLNQLLADFYEHRGWTDEGLPKKEKLKDLGLENVIKYGALY